MIEDLIYFIFVPAILGVITYSIRQFLRSGLLDAVEVKTTGRPLAFSSTTTLYYKHHIGSYSAHTSIVNELLSLLPNGATIVQIFYDDDAIVVDRRLQSAVGVVFGADNTEFYTPNYATQLKRFGYERFVIPALPSEPVRAVASGYDGGFFARYNASSRLRPTVSKAFDAAAKDKTAEKLLVQITDTSAGIIEVFAPLEGAEEFHDAQYLTSDELDAKFARQKFDSEEGSSESEPEHTETDAIAEDEEEDEEAADKAEEEDHLPAARIPEEDDVTDEAITSDSEDEEEEAEEDPKEQEKKH